MQTSLPNTKVNILLSTFNGIRFLSDQIDSLIHQDYASISICIRDDGSTDGTLELLKKYESQYSHIKLIEGENTGVRHSFFELVRSCGNEGELYAFCDQDDIWHPRKISRSVEMIQKSANPSMTLYISRLNLVKEDLEPINLSRVPHYIGFEHAVVESIAYGCSSMFGHGIKQLFLQANPDHMIMHDWWIYFIATTFGIITYDAEPQVLYRQHNHNVSGYKTGLKWRLKFWTKNFIERLFKGHRNIDFIYQAERFIETYNTIPTEKRAIVEGLLAIRSPKKFLYRFRYLFNSKLSSHEPIHNMALKLMILFGCH